MKIPEGWQLVPKVPTVEMGRRGVMLRSIQDEQKCVDTIAIYDAMLAAAPKYEGEKE